MYLLVNKAGKYFRLDYRYAGKRKTLSLGVYPETKLARAREKRDEAKRLLRDGVDPSLYKKEIKGRQEEEAVNNFEAVAREWFAKNKHIWTEGHARTILSRLEKNVFP